MNIERLKKNYHPSFDFIKVAIRKMGDITEVRYMANDMGGVIKRIDKDTYKNLITGEIKEYNHTEKRTDNIKNIKQSLKKLRDIINTNVTEKNIKNCLWVTLTYAENMTDAKRLYEDYRKFNMRFQTYLKKANLPHYESIVCAEVQRTWCISPAPVSTFLKNDDRIYQMQIYQNYGDLDL